MEQQQKDKIWIFPIFYPIFIMNIISTVKNIWFFKDALSKNLGPEYIPLVLTTKPEGLFLNKIHVSESSFNLQIKTTHCYLFNF